MIEERQQLPQQGSGLSIMAMMISLIVLMTGCLKQGVYHEVKKGQTLYRISKTYDVDEAYLARLNGIPNPTQLRIGTRIYIPGATSVRYVPATVEQKNISTNLKSPSKKTFKVVTKQPVQPTVKSRSSQQISPVVKSEPKQTSIIQTAPSVKSFKNNSKINVKLHWPLRGKILRAFGQGEKGGKGLEIAAKEGTVVLASAAGKVIYSGDGVQGFGHLMILQHENDIFTVYGYNSRNYVKQGQFVSQGEKIASSGRPPSGEDGRLHFEVRIGKKAVDPILYLP